MLQEQAPSNTAEPYVLAAAASGVVGMIETQGGDVDSIFGRAQIDTARLDAGVLNVTFGPP